MNCYCLLAYDVDEETLKGLVFNYGAVQTSIRARENSFKRYKGGMSIINLFYHYLTALGIYDGCVGSSTNHGIVIVGYGSEDGEDYWILKNSWGTKWGEGGFMRMKCVQIFFKLNLKIFCHQTWCWNVWYRRDDPGSEVSSCGGNNISALHHHHH